MAKTIYLGNPNLKRQNVEIDYTEDQIKEYVKCRDDPIYFTKNYIHIVFSTKRRYPFIDEQIKSELFSAIKQNLINQNVDN
jgi:hypothetical protein